jgi:serine/threonine protein kinase
VLPLGAGGMGEVYRALDTRLERIVALKILPEQFSTDAVRRQRFEREAKTISGLNHPNICVLHDVGSQSGVDYLVMEYIEGDTLAKRLERGPLPVEQVVRIGREIAEALDNAHRAGIVHRDLKPGNIMLTQAGAKLLDFGLAKPAAPLISGITLTAVPSPPMTQEGTIVGTFQYMSPEQVEGKDLDGRSDIFSLGAVLYEMLTGKRAFEGKTQLSVASAILEKEPEPINRVKPLAPATLDHTISRCLAKDPEQRWQTARDLALELRWVFENPSQIPGAPPLSSISFPKVLPWVLTALLAAALLAALFLRNPKPAAEAMFFPAPLSSPARDVAIAPNGRTVAIVAYLESARKNVLWIYELGSHSVKILPDTESATYPFWCPDGRSLAFFADGKLKKLDVAGGPVQTISDAPAGRGGTWNKDGVIVLAPDTNGGLYRVSALGGTPTPITTPDRSRGEDGHRWPVFLPDGKHYLYLTANFTGRAGVNAIFVGALDSNEKQFVVEAAANAAYTAPGYLLFYKDKTLLAQRFDTKRLALTGSPTTAWSDIQYLPQVRKAVFAVSDYGLLAAQSGSGVPISQPTWFDRSGREVGTAAKPDVYGNVFLAANGDSLAVDKTDMASLNVDIWTYALNRDSSKRLTFDPGLDAVPIWSPDSSRLVFGSNRQLNWDLFIKNADGSQDEKILIPHDGIAKFPDDWSRDGKFILYNKGTDLWSLALPETKGALLLKASSVLRNGQFSPDGKWVAYASNETGKWEVYVTSFPDARGKWQVSTSGGEQPRWRADGKELFYLSADGKMMAAQVTTGANFDARTPLALFQASPRQPVLVYDLFAYDVSRDGQRFLINTPVKQTETQPLSLVLNWNANLDK